MFDRLSISNYALIDQLEITFPQGLTVITGETGAGKSILLGALGLIIGQRADAGSLQDKSQKCIVEASFNLKNKNLQFFFQQHDLDFESSCTVRREINPEGKSRAFINDTPVNLQVLKELGDLLIDIHSQHETRTLNDSAFQLSMIDAFAGNENLLKDYEKGFVIFSSLNKRLNALIEQESALKRDQDYFQFQFTELENAGLDKLDLEKLESESEMLSHSEEIKSQLEKVSGSLEGGELNLVSSLNEIRGIFTGLSKYNVAIAELSERLTSTFIELKDISSSIHKISGGIIYDPERVEKLNEILDVVYRLMQKHQVKEVKELIEVREEFSKKLEGILSLETEILSLKNEIQKRHAELLKKAEDLSQRRKSASPAMEKEILKLLVQLGMPNSSIKLLSISRPEKELTSTGIDKISILFSANKGSEPKELGKVASGGELSRLMLSIKSLIAARTTLPTVIFDEIDTGVSGDVAGKVGNIMENMSGNMQVIAITHLPQIACKGNSHLFVYKELKNNKTFTRIKFLDKNERVSEVAKMLSTGNPTPAALKNAKELLNEIAE